MAFVKTTTDFILKCLICGHIDNELESQIGSEYIAEAKRMHNNCGIQITHKKFQETMTRFMELQKGSVGNQKMKPHFLMFYFYRAHFYKWWSQSQYFLQNEAVSNWTLTFS